jgi:hypothetical protein
MRLPAGRSGLGRRLRTAGLHLAVPGLALLALAARPAAQQTPVGLQNLQVALWPEFDQPAMLVIYRFELAPATPLPASLSLPIPAGIDAPHALAYAGPNGELLNIDDYSVQAAGAWSNLIFSTPGARGQLEFYVDLVRNGDQRSFRFEWPGGVGLEGFDYEVQQPPTAFDFTIVPAPTSQSAGQNGLTHYFGALQPTGAASIELSYRKPDDLLSADSLATAVQQPALSQPGPPSSGPDLQTALPWALGGLGAALLGAGVFLFLRRSRPLPERRPPRPRRRTGAETEASPIYCHQCGTRAGSSDVFCRQCGTRLRGR